MMNYMWDSLPAEKKKKDTRKYGKIFLGVFEIICVLKYSEKNRIKIQDKKVHGGEPSIWSSFSPETSAAGQF